MNYILFDDDLRDNLLPIVHTRPVCEIRVGILRIREKWEMHLGNKISYLTSDYLQNKFPLINSEENILINGSILPNYELTSEINSLSEGEILMDGEIIIAAKTKNTIARGLSFSSKNFSKTKNVASKVNRIQYNWDIFSKNEGALKEDYLLITKGRKSSEISKTNTAVCPENIFIEEGAKVECTILNASAGYIYIGKDSEVMEGSMIRGPFALCEHSQIKMGAKIYGGTTIGPYSKVGGEVSNSVIMGYSNKGHDGFLGNSVLGEWCNLGADTNNSNLKNNYSKIKVWNYKDEDYINTGLQFCGLIMGDHSKCSINTMFNTGTVVGVSANIFGNGFPPKFVPSFSWGGAEGFTTYRIEDALEVASRVYERRGIELNKTEEELLKVLFENTTKYRSW